jgi:hypothetical protein
LLKHSTSCIITMWWPKDYEKTVARRYTTSTQALHGEPVMLIARRHRHCWVCREGSSLTLRQPCLIPLNSQRLQESQP